MSIPASFGIRCPGASTFYASNNASAYLGCCAVDPATTSDGLCPDDDIRPIAFNPSAYSDIPSQDCVGNDALWYSCTSTEPPFLGCCSVNPCAKGKCPQSALRSARLSSNESSASAFLGASTSTSTTSTASLTATSSTTTSSATASATSSPSPTAPAADNTHSGLQPATIAGIAIGAFAAVFGMILLFLFLRKRRQVAAKRDAFIANSFTARGPDTTQSPSTPSWMYSSSPHSQCPANSPCLSPYHYSTHESGSSISPVKHPKFAKPEPGPTPMPVSATTPSPAVELPGNVCFELLGDTPPRGT